MISVPEHERLNEFDPATAIVTSSVPDEALLPDQVPDAEQEEARVDDQVKVTLLLTCTETSDEAIVTVAVGNAGADDPPPPPPQEIIRKNDKAKDAFFRTFIFFNLTLHN